MGMRRAEVIRRVDLPLALPLVMFGFILFFNRDYANMLLARPQLVLGCLVSEGIGALWIRRIINFDF